MGCESSTPPPSTNEDSLAYSGGATTVFLATGASFSTPAPNLSIESEELHFKGDLAFEQAFVNAPAPVASGLGPVFNNISCSNCHAGDGRGRPPEAGQPFSSILMRISIPGTDAHGGPMYASGFGKQLQQRGVIGKAAEVSIHTSFQEISGTYEDGTPYSLRKPIFAITNSYIPLPPDAMYSTRIAPAVFGLGLLEAIPESTLRSLADEADANGDGISGKANYVYDPESGTIMIGRFGWKANNPTLYAQTAGAYNEDMGVTSSLLKVESCHGQPQADTSLVDDPEIDDEVLKATTFYVRTLAVPARRKIGDELTRTGEKIFVEAKCASCHVQKIQTGYLKDVPEVSYQTIRPYSDLLLHDMGEGLSDGRPDYLASGTEWRTPPLWGIGLTKLVSGFTYFLHDGRARTLEEAILWHGGEAEPSREHFRKLPKADRDALIAFLQSL